MNFILLFGQSLAEILNKPLYHSVGLIRLSIKDSGRDPNTPLTHQDYKEVFQIYLLKRLRSLHVNDPEGIVDEMVRILNDKQSLFTMSIH